MSRTPHTRKDETHQRIVEVAARAIRRRGYAGVGVAEVMKEAGLTHGGFYAHFASREALLVEALAHAANDSAAIVASAAQARAAKGVSAFRALVETYLSDTLLGALDRGCPVAALGSEMPRQSPAVRDASARRVEWLIGTVRDALPGATRAGAGVIAGTLVGTLQLARALGDNAAGRSLLAATRKSLLEQHDHGAGR